MRVVINPRQAGKTTEAVKWVQGGDDRIIVVISEKEKERLMKQYGLRYQQVETYDTLLRNYYRPTLHQKKVVLDNLDMWVESMFRETGGIEWVTVSKPDAESPR